MQEEDLYEYLEEMYGTSRAIFTMGSAEQLKGQVRTTKSASRAKPVLMERNQLCQIRNPFNNPSITEHPYTIKYTTKSFRFPRNHSTSIFSDCGILNNGNNTNLLFPEDSLGVTYNFWLYLFYN